jgi:DNA-binding NarL/FixJ family response regulator
MTCPRIRIVAVDDHPVVLRGLAALLEEQGDLELVGVYNDGATALQGILDQRPDVAILDVHLPSMSGLEALSRLRKQGLDTKVIILTASLTKEQTHQARRLGALGVVMKDAALDTLVNHIRTVAGGVQLAWPLVQSAEGERIALLTPAELKVARLFACALDTKEIACQLQISPGTARLHLHRIYRKLNVRNRVALSRLVDSST